MNRNCLSLLDTAPLTFVVAVWSSGSRQKQKRQYLQSCSDLSAVIMLPFSCQHSCPQESPWRNLAWSLPSFLEQQLHEQTRASWAPLTDGGPPYPWQIEVINFSQGHLKTFRTKQTQRQNSGELRKYFSMSYSTSSFSLVVKFLPLHHIWAPDDNCQSCASFWSYQLQWWKSKISKEGHHLSNHDITHQMTGSHCYQSFKWPHLHLVIIIRLSVRLIGIKLQWTYSLWTHTKIQTVLPCSPFICRSFLHTHTHTHTHCTHINTCF